MILFFLIFLLRNEALFDDEIKEKILYHIQLILPILQVKICF